MKFKNKRLLRLAVLFITCVLATAIIVSATRTRRTPAVATEIGAITSKTVEHSVKTSAAVPQLGAVSGLANTLIAPPSADAVEVEVITIHPNGFEPRQITRPQGSLMLAISNHTGLSELSLRLDRVSGNRIHEVSLPRGRVRWNKVFDLPPGDYVLSEQNHPDWICRLKLTAR